MNIHPFLVHFPIALLVFYALFEFASAWCAGVRGAAWVERMKASLLGAGVAFGAIAAVFGALREESLESLGAPESLHSLMETHASFAILTLAVFLIPAAAYAVSWYTESGHVHGAIRRAARIVMRAPVRISLAAAGLILILITGALGAAIAHGPQTDVFVSFIYDIFIR